MAIEEFEFTIDDVLAVHRGWITKLFVEDMKSEVEIVQLLYERQFIVTLPQIRQYLQKWKLIPNASSTIDCITTASQCRANHEEWEIIPSLRSPSNTGDGQPISTPTSEILDMHRTRPLPSLPSIAPSSSGGSDDSSIVRTTPSHPPLSDQPRKKEKFTAGEEFSNYKAEVNFTSTRDGNLPLEAFLKDHQSHERLAVGLDRIPRTLEYPRTGERLRDGIRKPTRSRKNANHPRRQDKQRTHEDREDL